MTTERTSADRTQPGECEGLHRFEDLGWPGLVVRYACRVCGCSVQVEFPTQRDGVAVRAWLDRHPGVVRARGRAGES